MLAKAAIGLDIDWAFCLEAANICKQSKELLMVNDNLKGNKKIVFFLTAKDPYISDFFASSGYL